jgi:hypothetical protein
MAQGKLGLFAFLTHGRRLADGPADCVSSAGSSLCHPGGPGQFWELFLSNMPYLSTHPIGLPPSRKYLVRVENSEAYEFSWSYPYLVVGGSRYRFNKYVIDKDNPLRFQTANGTLFEFVRNPETIRS